MGKAGRTVKKRRKEGGKRGEYFRTNPKERQTNGERKAQSANRERRRTKRLLKDYQKARRVLLKED